MGARGRIFIFVLLTAAAATGASPQEPPAPAPPAASQTAEPPLSLDEAFALATANNRTITAARLRRAIDQAGMDVASERHEAGAVARLEVVQAELNLDEAENETTAVAGERDASRAELNSLIGRDPRAPTQVVEDLADVTLPAAEAAAAAAMAGNAELAVLDRQMTEAVARAALARAQQVPDPTLEGAVTHDAPGEFVWGWRYAVGVTVPIFTRHRAAVRVEEATIAQLKAQREALVQRLEGAGGAPAGPAETPARQGLRDRGGIPPRGPGGG